MCQLTKFHSHNEKKWLMQFPDGLQVKASKYTGWCVWINVINGRAGPFIFHDPSDQVMLWILQMKRYERQSKNWPSQATLPTVTFFFFPFSLENNQGYPLKAECVVTLHTVNHCFLCPNSREPLLTLCCYMWTNNKLYAIWTEWTA